MSDFVDLFTDSTTGLIPEATTSVVDVLEVVLPFLVGIILVGFAIRWIRRGLKGR